ncbi:nucleotidyltransferase family protein [Nocardioides hwasunensis]|uniref:Nucleotidyltransferase family protein n=1 Tax=Nocardioides hwasunensis TaxID=397258 RepID=A0ABR8MP03_9ACTN|nr:nucleotidyltransferase family protein [Nocardioides hwasunensis]MBD3917026.1 nucleotidyltransferase family protein [Nocardioides hwasunensis]
MDPTSEELAEDELGHIPVAARVHLSHAVVQQLADRGGIDVLHLKGPAVLPGLREPGRHSSDVDVLVRPSHLPLLVTALESIGWEQRTTFATGSVFAHAANWWHDDWGWVDVHLHWPGVTIEPELAFEVFSRDLVQRDIAHRPCPVPNATAQRLILVLHSARSGGTTDVEHAWGAADTAEQDDVRALAAELGAEVALAAGIGELEQHRGHPTYLLWRHFVEGGSRMDEWRARWAAARGARAKTHLLTAAMRVNQDHLRMELGRPPTREEVRAKQRERWRKAAGEVEARVRRS